MITNRKRIPISLPPDVSIHLIFQTMNYVAGEIFKI